MKFILDNNLCNGKFSWQDTASAFSVSKSDIDKVCKYILNQLKHHKKITLIILCDESYGLILKHTKKKDELLIFKKKYLFL